MSKFDREDYETYKEFELSSREVDLNGDRRAEVIAWISSWGGTSGQSLYILSKQRGGYRKIWTNESTWTPIILLPSKHYGWKDLAFLITGGGVDTHFALVRNDGKRYRAVDGPKSQPMGRVLLGKDWQQTIFGPTRQ